MKLIRAEFENFRLLRSLTLDFSTDDSQKLTVIRAENESGKTTILNALKWALYGDDALPGKRHEFRLSPIDWDITAKTNVPISVQVDFETSVRHHRSRILSRRRFRIIRSTSESVSGRNWTPASTTVDLFSLDETGASPINAPEARIQDELPPELQDVFFTDGDRALSFVETTVSNSTKRGRVQAAIRSLLGLGVIEDALNHVNKAASDLNKEAKKLGFDEELNNVYSELIEVDNDIGEYQTKVEDAVEQFTAFDEKLAEVSREIDETLIKGNREELQREIEGTKRQIKQLDSQQLDASKEHAGLFRKMALSRDLMATVLEKGLSKLDELRDQRKIPNITLPVLEERLKNFKCICGESLDEGDEEGNTRRKHILHLIEESRKADSLQHTVTDLYYASRTLQRHSGTENELWLTEYNSVFKRRDELQALREEQGKRLSAIEAKLDEIPDTDIKGLRKTESEYAAQRDRFQRDSVRYETHLSRLKEKQLSLSTRRDNLLRRQRRGDRVLAQLNVSQDVKQILERSYDRVTKEELKKVSDHMNKVFLEMIGADPDQRAIIQSTEISGDFDILVYGPHDRVLNPDRDLNGASRRALTLAFILALTRVSQVEAPNVIDTPLGMMSGYVKRSVLNTAVRESSQLVLFLTRSEIAGCEDIIEKDAGCIITLTNPAHYPRMLVNEPNVDVGVILRCECNHTSECSICARRIEIEA